MSDQDQYNPVISVIVPIYNTVPYLEECISSVLHQTYDSFELLLVDDGSEDGSREICQQVCKKDSRIRFIPVPEHKGISHTRNLGMEAASGSYLFFLDSDDCLHPQLLEQMLREALKTKADITRVEYATSREMDENAWKKYCSEPYHPEWIVSSGDAIWNQWCRARGRDSVRQTLYYRKSVGNLRFDETISIAEDALFNYEFMTVFPRKYSYSDTPGYYYRIRDNSITKQPPLERLLMWIGVKSNIRDQELSLGRTQYAIVLEQENVQRMRSWMYNQSGSKGEIEIVRKKLKEERHHPLFHCLPFDQRFKVFLSCYCLPINNLLVTIKHKAGKGQGKPR